MLPSNTNKITPSFENLLTYSLAMGEQHPRASGEAQFPSVKVSKSMRKILAETSRTSTHPKSRLHMQNNTHSAGGLDPTIFCSGVWLPNIQYFTESRAIGLQMAISADLQMAILIGYDSTCLQS